MKKTTYSLMNITLIPQFISLLLGAGSNPKANADSSDVSYKVIDDKSPPYFLNTSRSLVYTTLGRTVILICRVRNLGNRAVSKFVSLCFSIEVVL